MSAGVEDKNKAPPPLQIHLVSPSSSNEESTFYLDTPYHTQTTFDFEDTDSNDDNNSSSNSSNESENVRHDGITSSSSLNPTVTAFSYPRSVSTVTTFSSFPSIEFGGSSDNNNNISDATRLQQELDRANRQNEVLKEQIEQLTKMLANTRIQNNNNDNSNDNDSDDKSSRRRASSTVTTSSSSTPSSPLLSSMRPPVKLSSSVSDESVSTASTLSATYVPARYVSQRPSSNILTGQADFKAIFEAVPNPFCVLDTDAPHFTVVAANNAYLKATLRKRHEMVGKGLFQVFPDNPTNETPGESRCRVSFMRVIATKQMDAMAVQKYDIEEPIGSGNWNAKWWTPINFPIWTPSGKMYILHRVEEVTEFMRQESRKDIEMAETLQHVKRVDDSQERYTRLTTLLPIGVFHTSNEGELSYVNERWEKIAGCVWRDVANEHKKWYEYVSMDQRDALVQSWRAKPFVPFQAEYVYASATGEAWYMVHLVPEISQLKNLKGYLGYIIDITERKQAEEVAKKRVEQLAELDRQKTMFFSNISHELRTPLTLILGPAEDSLGEIGRQALQPRQRERMEVIQRSAQRLLKLVNSSLDFTRLEEGRISTNFEPTDLSGFSNVLARLFRPAMENAQLVFTTTCLPLSEPCYVDRDLWQKILFNLLSNALKYTLKGNVDMIVKQGENYNVLLVVQDTGIGIPKQEIPNMFQRFHRIANLNGRSHEGAGIGLSLTQQLVKLHGGTIEVTSELGKGSVFTVSIPLGYAHLPADRIREQTTDVTNAPGMSAQLFVKEALTWMSESSSSVSPSPATSTKRLQNVDVSPSRLCSETPPISPSHSPSPSASSQRRFHDTQLVPPNIPYTAAASSSSSSPPQQQEKSNNINTNSNGACFKVLVADDNADMRKLLYNLLSTEFSVTVVGDGEEAWNATKTEKYDLIVSDLMMPKMDGFDLIKALRADEKTQTLPVILLSARVDEESRLRGLHLGADDFVVKPFSKRELMERVGGRLRVGRWRHQLTQELHDFQDESQRQKRLLQLVSHELRNPLVGIKGNSEIVDFLLENIETTLTPLLQDSNSNSGIMLRKQTYDNIVNKVNESRAAIRIVLQCTDYQKIVCDDVLDMAKLKASKMELHLTSFDPAQIVKDAVRMLSVRAQQGEIKLSAECKMRQRIVSGDATRLTQILVNLISNAIKFTPKKGSITVTLQSQSETAEKIELQFIVSDTGMGMSEEQQAKIFSPFTQASAAISSQFGGTGLGLSISKSLVELMGGHIKVTSALGKGSTFAATVYCGNVFVAEAPKILQAKQLVEQKKLVVMVVDDTIINQRILKRMLEIAGHVVVVANNGQEGLNLWSQMVKVDAILMDLNMPVMGGLEATKCIRQIERQKADSLGNNTAATHIIGLSGDNADTVAWREAGMNDYVVKPYNQKDLLEKLQAAATRQ